MAISYTSRLGYPIIAVLIAFSFSGLGKEAHKHETLTRGTPSETLDALVRGNQRFMSGVSQHARQDAKTRQGLATGQNPPAIIVSCSDSRVPPEIVFDQGLGQVFVIRVAGQVLGSNAIASIEYAVEHLGSNLILVMGHQSCGAVKAAIATPPGKSAGSANLDLLVAAIRPNLAGRKIASEGSGLSEAVKANVSGVAKDLMKQSEIIRDAVDTQRVAIAEAVYSLESGKVEILTKQEVKAKPTGH